MIMDFLIIFNIYGFLTKMLLLVVYHKNRYFLPYIILDKEIIHGIFCIIGPSNSIYSKHVLFINHSHLMILPL